MDIAHLLSKQKGLADLAQGISPTSPAMTSLQEIMAEASACIRKIQMEKCFWDIGTTGELLRISELSMDIQRQITASLPQPQDTISRAIADASRQMYEAFDPIRQSVEQTKKIMEDMRPFGPLAQFNSTSAIIEQLMQQTSFSLRAESYILEGAYPNLARALDPMKGRYQEWIDALGTFDSPTLQSLTPVIAIPSTEYFHAIDSLRPIIQVDLSEELEEQWEEESANEDDLPEFEELLRKLSPASWERWMGAETALKNRPPDYARHVAASLREFFDHLLLELAPHKDIEKHLAERGEVLKDKPGWGLRIKVATIRVGQPSFTNFIEERGKIFSLNMKVVQETVHAGRPLHSHAQLVHHFRSCKALAQSLLEIRYLEGLPERNT